MNDRNALCNFSYIKFSYAIELIAQKTAIIILKTYDIQISTQ